MYQPTGIAQRGFTLIELSIVLVIIGFIVGSVLVGQDLIRAAEARGIIAQIEKYNTATNTFRGKYDALPGDLNAATATQFGFAARGQYAGEGDGNGVIEGVLSNAAGQNSGTLTNIGETTMFWADLSYVHMVDGTINTATSTTPFPGSTTTANPDLVLPAAKLGRGNYIYVWSGGWEEGATPPASDGANYFGIVSANGNSFNGNGQTFWAPGLAVQEAYNIDKKMDDGLPQSGNVLALYTYGGYAYWAAAGAGGQGNLTTPTNAPTTAATPWAPTTCYDNNNIAGQETYSLAKNSNQVNCALSFRFQ